MHSGVLSTSAVSFVDVHNLALDELKRRFLALFPRRGESIRKNPQHKRWFTQHGFALSDGQIMSAIDGRLKHFIGTRFANRTQFAVLDIDADSPYHNVLSLVRLRRSLESVGLNNTHLYQSSESGGWHLYVFFDQWVDAGEVNKLLGAWLRKNAFTVKSGTLEIFPSANGLRLPLQRGFAFLADDCKREQLTLEQALKRFIADSFVDNDWSAAANQLAQQLVKPRQDSARKKKRSGLIPDRWKLGKLLWQQGLQFYGQRHDAILAVEHYLWYGDDDAGVEAMPGYHNDAAREQLMLNWLEKKHNGHCKHINKGDWRTVEKDIQRACVWRTSENIHQPYAHTERKIERMMEDRSLTPRRFITGNIARYNFALRRITEAYNELSTGGRVPSINEVARKACSDWKTVRKHWNLLAGSGGDQSLRIDPPAAVSSSKAVEASSPPPPSNQFEKEASWGFKQSQTNPVQRVWVSPPAAMQKSFCPLEPSQLNARSFRLDVLTQDSFRIQDLQFTQAKRDSDMPFETANENSGGNAPRYLNAFEGERIALSPAAIEPTRLLPSNYEMQAFQGMQRQSMQKGEKELFLDGGTLDLNLFDGTTDIYGNARDPLKQYAPQDVTARDWGALVKKGLERVVQSAQNPDLLGREQPPEGGDPMYPRRGREDDFIDYSSCARANTLFPNLAKCVGDGPGKVDPDLIAATIRNEQYYFNNQKDAGPENYVQKHHAWPLNADESLGPGQIQVRNMQWLANQYPLQLGDPADAVRNGTDVHRAPSFVADYFADVINAIHTKQKLSYIAANTWKQINEHWHKGECNEALIIAYNPDPNQIAHVFTQLDNIKAPDWD